ncbi:MAG: FkbM family methyltransferase [Planctomycetes bacterium]|nr:FkbM family methyltransferase [Planctomycetota bacterium]
MKRFFVNSILGHFALAARDKFGLLRTALSQPESVGTLANDQLATMLITRICQPGKTFVDVGAHIGSVISEVLRHDRRIRVIAIEAIPEKVAHLRRKFRNVEVVECAVGESAGDAPFFVNKSQSAYSSLSRPSGASIAFREIRVRIERLDGIVPWHEVDAIKIDVEGAELGVIRGSEKTLSESRPSVMFESAPIHGNDGGYTKEDLWNQFSKQSYSILVPNRVAHNDDGLSLEGFLESHLYPRRSTNYFAIPNERRVEIRDHARRIIGVKVTN